MQKRKRFYSLLSLLLGLLVVLAGCSSGSGKTSGNSGGKDSSGKTHITLGLWGTGQEIKREQDLVDHFMKDNPNIKVKLVYKDWDSYWTWITSQAAAKDLPDVYKIDPAYLPQYADLGAMKDLGSLMKKSGFKKSNYKPSVLKILQNNGQQVALPRDANTIVMAYNKDMFKKAGVKEPEEKMSWQQVLKMAKKLTLDTDGNNASDPGFDPKHIKQWGLGLDPAGTADSVLEPELWSNGARLVDKNHKLALNTPKAMKVLKFFKDLTAKYHVNIPAAQLKKVGNDPALVLSSKKVAMSFTGSWNVDTLKQAGIDFGVFLPPKFNKVQTVVQPAGYAMSPYTKQEDAAWKLLSWMSGPEGQKIMAKKGQAIPANKKAIKTYKQSVKNDSFDSQVFFDAPNYAIPDPYFKGKQKLWWEYIPQKLEQPLNGKGGISEAVKQTAGLWDPTVK